MANGNRGLLRRVWNTLIAWERAMDNSPYDYAIDRIGRLEREVAQLKDDLKRTRTPGGAAGGGFGLNVSTSGN